MKIGSNNPTLPIGFHKLTDHFPYKAAIFAVSGVALLALGVFVGILQQYYLAGGLVIGGLTLLNQARKVYNSNTVKVEFLDQNWDFEIPLL
jgi:hypothetical protein